MRQGALYLSFQTKGTHMTDEGERGAHNKALIARLGAPPTKAQILAEIDLEISDAIGLATAANLRGVTHLLRMAKLEVAQIQRRELKDEAGD
jgi:hypothetical protein